MNTNEKQIALSVLESLRADLIYAHLNNGSRILDVADLRQYIYEKMGRIRTNALVMSDLYGNDNGHGQDISKSNGHWESASIGQNLAGMAPLQCSSNRPLNQSLLR